MAAEVTTVNTQRAIRQSECLVATHADHIVGAQTKQTLGAIVPSDNLLRTIDRERWLSQL
jgi:hypothetical protein